MAIRNPTPPDPRRRVLTKRCERNRPNSAWGVLGLLGLEAGLDSGNSVVLVTPTHVTDLEDNRKISIARIRIILFGEALPCLAEKGADKGSRAFVEGRPLSRGTDDQITLAVVVSPGCGSFHVFEDDRHPLFLAELAKRFDMFQPVVLVIGETPTHYEIQAIRDTPWINGRILKRGQCALATREMLRE